MTEKPRWRRPSFWEAVSTLVLVALTFVPVALWFTAPWGWGLFFAFYLWPSTIVCLRLMTRERTWLVITEGPGIVWAGRVYGFKGRRG